MKTEQKTFQNRGGKGKNQAKMRNKQTSQRAINERFDVSMLNDTNADVLCTLSVLEVKMLAPQRPTSVSFLRSDSCISLLRRHLDS